MLINSKDLHLHGWCECQTSETSSLNEQLIKIASQLGRPVPSRNSVGIVQELIPSTKAKFANSLSSKYKNGFFPLHTDTAHWPIPCRYIVLGCSYQGENERKTFLLNFRNLPITKIERNYLMSEPFKILNGRKSFYGTVLEQNRPFIRYDPGCMSPISPYGEIALDAFSQQRTARAIISIDWFEGKIVVIDNWRVLHGRSNGLGKGSERIISRILVA